MLKMRELMLNLREWSCKIYNFCFKIRKELKFETFKFGGLEKFAYLCKM